MSWILEVGWPPELYHSALAIGVEVAWDVARSGVRWFVRPLVRVGWWAESGVSVSPVSILLTTCTPTQTPPVTLYTTVHCCTPQYTPIIATHLRQSVRQNHLLRTDVILSQTVLVWTLSEVGFKETLKNILWMNNSTLIPCDIQNDYVSIIVCAEICLHTVCVSSASELQDLKCLQLTLQNSFIAMNDHAIENIILHWKYFSVHILNIWADQIFDWDQMFIRSAKIRISNFLKSQLPALNIPLRAKNISFKGCHLELDEIHNYQNYLQSISAAHSTVVRKQIDI